MQNKQFYKEYCRPFHKLQIGDSVQIPKKDSRYTRHWAKTWRIADILRNRQYRVQLDGSNRKNLRKRLFLRMVHPGIVIQHHSTKGAGPSASWHPDLQPVHDSNTDNTLTTSRPERYDTSAGLAAATQ